MPINPDLTWSASNDYFTILGGCRTAMHDIIPFFCPSMDCCTVNHGYNGYNGYNGSIIGSNVTSGFATQSFLSLIVHCEATVIKGNTALSELQGATENR